MPELPEVETIVTGLRDAVLHKNISGIDVYRKGTLVNNRNIIELGTIRSITRRGKYIIFMTSNQAKVIIHLRMTGKLLLKDTREKNNRHTRAKIRFDDGTSLFFDDIRTFGKIWIFRSGDEVPGLEILGPEPLEKDFNEQFLKLMLLSRKAPVKNLLLDQKIVAGMGNIYASEILFRAGILPDRPGNSLSEKEIAKLVEITKKVLQEAIASGGTTFSDYRQIEDRKGNYQNKLSVYKKEVCSCGNQLSRIKLAGRSTYFCSKCQN